MYTKVGKSIHVVKIHTHEGIVVAAASVVVAVVVVVYFSIIDIWQLPMYVAVADVE
jgi:hypothetical protein